MASYTERNAGWSSDPAPPGADVHQLARIGGDGGGTEQIHEDDFNFVAVYSWHDVTQSGFPDEIEKACNGPTSHLLHEFVDRSNPFYEPRTSMYAVRRRNVQQLTEMLESKGYEYAVKLEQSQFKFIPRPTVGEIIVKDKNAQP